MDLAYDDFALPGDPHVSVTIYIADPGTPSTDALTLPATWAETHRVCLMARHGDGPDTLVVRPRRQRPELTSAQR
ncbi:hypothetical protein [Streptomyces sp. SLBN-8D4]|jgi:hypothetical protein|uniref:hypothetical protein n=1 Tax=Streptomyces sp. SLBN-8D4 TaxID=3377728 RepID=UPI003C7AC22B